MRFVALVVGVPAPDTVELTVDGSTTHLTFEALPGVAGDIAWYHRFLGERAAGMVEVSAVDIRVLQGPDETTAAAIGSAVASLTDALDSGDLFVLVLCGHGVQVPRPASSQGDLRDLDPSTTELFIASDTALPHDTFVDLWGRLPWGVRVVSIIDACSADGMIFFAAPDPQFVITSRPGASVIAIAATSELGTAGETTFLRGRRGLLSAALQYCWSNEHPTSWRRWASSAARQVALSRSGTPVLRYVGPAPADLDGAPFHA